MERADAAELLDIKPARGAEKVKSEAERLFQLAQEPMSLHVTAEPNAKLQSVCAR